MKLYKRIISFAIVAVMILSSLSTIPGISTIFADGDSKDVKVETDPNDKLNIAYKKPTRSNSVTGDSSLAVDGSSKTKWTGKDYPKYVDIDLLENYDITKINLLANTSDTHSFTIYGSLDGVSFSRIYKSEGYVKFTNSGLDIEFDKAQTYRIIRINITGVTGGTSKSAVISEVKIYGNKNDSTVVPTRDKIELKSYEEWLKDYCGFDVSTIADANGNYDIKKTFTEKDTIDELNGIVTRLLGNEYISWFDFDVTNNPNGNGKSFFKIEDSNGKIKISGSTGCDIASGLNWYLKYYCYVSITQETSQVKMPESIVKVGSDIFYETDISVRYAYNYCTLSYTMPFFGYDDWRRELDWLYLQGVNLILDITGTEALWVHYLQQLGYSADDAKNYIVGYSYKAWWLMGNIEGFGGTVSDSWVVDTLEMARINERSMTVMGASPALETFVGAFPETFGTIAKQHLLDKGFSDVSKSLAAQGDWCGLVRPNVLRTDYDGYEYLAKMFYDSQNYIYGQVTDYYCGDVCHEGGIIPSGLKKEDMALKILNQLLASDEKGVWILQRWWDNPIREVLDGFGEYRKSNVMVIDLASAQDTSKYKDTSKYGSKEFGGTLWIFSSLDNFGGRPTMHGTLKKMCDNIAEAKKNSKYMRGLGITPEGTQNNPVVFDLYWEMIWRNETPDLNQWVKDYAHRRYGKTNETIEKCWEDLLKVVYSTATADGTSVNTVIGTISKFDYQGGYYIASYNNLKLETNLENFMSVFDEFCDSEGYIYDIVDIMQTYLANLAGNYLGIMRMLASNAVNYDKYKIAEAKFLDCLLLVNEVSSYSENQLVGKWIGRAYSWINDERTGSYDDYDYDNMTFNAKALISSWLTSGNLIDYANRLYNGLVYDYYYQSWSKFFASIDSQVKNGKKSDTQVYSTANHLRDAIDFINNGKNYSSVANPAKGNETSRGLDQIYKYISANHHASQTMPQALTALNRIDINPDSGIIRYDGVLNGVTSNATVKEISGALVYNSDCKISFTDYTGNSLGENDSVSTGCRIYLSKSNGKMLDCVIIGSVTYASEEEAAKAESIMNELREFIDFANKLDREGIGSNALKKMDEALQSANTIVSSDMSYSLSMLEKTIEDVRIAKTRVQNEYDAIHKNDPTPTPTDNTDDLNKSNNSTAIIIIAVVIIVVALCAALLTVIIKKKKSN